MICRAIVYNKYFNQFINLLKFSPIKVNNKHKNKDEKIYKKAIKIFLLTIRSIVSIENVEKVVKEPKTPIIKKYFIKSCDKLLFSSKTIK